MDEELFAYSGDESEPYKPRSMSDCKTHKKGFYARALVQAKRKADANTSVPKCVPNVILKDLQELRKIRRICNSNSPRYNFRASTANRLAQAENQWTELKQKLPSQGPRKKSQVRGDESNISNESIELPKNKRTFSAFNAHFMKFRHQSPDSTKSKPRQIGANFIVMGNKRRVEDPSTGSEERKLSREEELLKIAMSVKNCLDDSKEETRNINTSYSPRNHYHIRKGFRYIRNAKIDLSQVITDLNKNEARSPLRKHDKETEKAGFKHEEKAKLLALHEDGIKVKPKMQRANTQRKLEDSKQDSSTIQKPKRPPIQKEENTSKVKRRLNEVFSKVAYKKPTELVKGGSYKATKGNLSGRGLACS